MPASVRQRLDNTMNQQPDSGEAAADAMKYNVPDVQERANKAENTDEILVVETVIINAEDEVEE
jgi:hypothetical protein